MFNIALMRLLQAIPVMLVIITVTFLLIQAAPGGPFDNEKNVSEQTLQQLQSYYALDKPLHIQYWQYLKQLTKGDLGPSYRYTNRSINEIITTSFPVTLELALYAICYALFIGLAAGIIASLCLNKAPDYAVMSFAMLGICLPSFLLGPLLVLIFGIQFGYLPVSGWGLSTGDKILPAITLGSAYAAYIARLTRGGMLDILTADYIRTAHAKGLPYWKVIIKHTLPGGLSPVIPFLGPALAGLLTGSFVVETVFQIPGLGRFYVQAAFNRDYTMILGTTIFFATLIIVFNLLSDIVSIWLNPKLRHSE